MILLVTLLSFSLICSEKFNFSSSNRPRCFWVDFPFIGRLFKKTTGWLLILFLREKITYWACLETSGLNDIFDWYAHWEIFHKSSLSLFEEFKWSLTTKKTGVSSAKSLGLESNLLGKSLIRGIPKGPLLWKETTWTTDHWGLRFGACFWEISFLVRNIFQRDQDVLIQKGSLHARLCQMHRTYQETDPSYFKRNICIEWFVDVMCNW